MNRPPCAGETELFYSMRAPDQARAKAVCRCCPLVVRCLTAALIRREPAGIWGGMSYSEREAVVEALRKRVRAS